MKVTIEMSEYDATKIRAALNTIENNRRYLDISKNIIARYKDDNFILITQQGKLVPCIRLQ